METVAGSAVATRQSVMQQCVPAGAAPDRGRSGARRTSTLLPPSLKGGRARAQRPISISGQHLVCSPLGGAAPHHHSTIHVHRKNNGNCRHPLSSSFSANQSGRCGILLTPALQLPPLLPLPVRCRCTRIEAPRTIISPQRPHFPSSTRLP